jgi:hypothetical protein
MPMRVRPANRSVRASASALTLARIAPTVRHATEVVYRHQIRPVLQDGATAMDRIFPSEDQEP